MIRIKEEESLEDCNLNDCVIFSDTQKVIR